MFSGNKPLPEAMLNHMASLYHNELSIDCELPLDFIFLLGAPFINVD